MADLLHLLRLADAFIAATAIKEVTLSHRVFGDSKKIGMLRGGGDITVTRYNAAIDWFAANWPADAAWPAGIARPEAAA
ncbi:MAG: hypothetical protein AB7L41_04570 [Flavobacteriaceae bacterium]